MAVRRSATPSPHRSMTGTTFDIKLTGRHASTLTPTDKSLQSVVAAINGDRGRPVQGLRRADRPRQVHAAAHREGDRGEHAPSPARPASTELGTRSATTARLERRDRLVGADGAATRHLGLEHLRRRAARRHGHRRQGAGTGDPAVTIDWRADADGIAAKVQAMVDNANVALTEIASQTKIKIGDVAAGAAGRRQRDAQAQPGHPRRCLRRRRRARHERRDRQLQPGRHLAWTARQADLRQDEVHRRLQGRPGQDPEVLRAERGQAGGTADKFDPGFDTAIGLGRKLETDRADRQRGRDQPRRSGQGQEGILQGLIQRSTDTITSLNDQVSDWDVRLDLRKAALQKQFSSLEVALGKMKHQSSWLAGQLAGLG